MVKFEYFGNSTVAFKAFKTGKIDVWEETDTSAWAQKYDFNAIKNGKVSKVEIPHQHEIGMNAFVFNTCNLLFADEKVHCAMEKAFDFELLNKKFYHGSLTRTFSLFTTSSSWQKSYCKASS